MGFFHAQHHFSVSQTFRGIPHNDGAEPKGSRNHAARNLYVRCMPLRCRS